MHTFCLDTYRSCIDVEQKSLTTFLAHKFFIIGSILHYIVYYNVKPSSDLNFIIQKPQMLQFEIILSFQRSFRPTQTRFWVEWYGN